MQVFTPVPGIAQSNLTNPYKYITINAGENNYFGKAPILGIKIEENTDVNIMKNLGGGINIACFSDQPAIIQLSGVTQIIDTTKSCNKNAATKTLADFYKEYKVSKQDSKTLSLVIGKQTFNAILLKVIKQSWQQDKFPGLMVYTLVLMGKKTGAS